MDWQLVVAVILIIGGIVQLVRGAVWLGIALIVLGVLLAPGILNLAR